MLGKMVKLGPLEEVAFTLRSKARGMNHAKNKRSVDGRAYAKALKQERAWWY